MKLIRIWLIVLISFAVLTGTQAQSLSDSVDVIHYDIHLDILDIPQQTISGITGVSFVSLQYADFINLELKQLEVISVKDVFGQYLNFSQTGDRLHIEFQYLMMPGDSGKVNIEYAGVPFHESWGGFHFSNPYAYNLGVGFQSIPHNLGKAWFPCVDDFKDRAFYDYHITVSETNKAVCGGLLQSVNYNGNGTYTYHWKTFRTIPTYLASVAVGPYALVEDVFEGEVAEVPITYYVRPSDTSKVAGSFVNMQNIAGIFEDKFGAYPFSRIGITGTGLGAMEHAENIFYPNSSINGNTSNEWLYAHELSHMWFGNKVTCATDADMWLNEGFARWCEIVFTEFLYSPEEADDYFKELHHSVLRSAHLTDGGYFPLFPMPQNITYGSTTYDKGGITVHALRNYLGDSLFFPAIRHYLESNAFSHASSFDLKNALAAESNTELSDFFEAYVFNPGFRHYGIDSVKVEPVGGQYQATVYLRQRMLANDFYADNNRVDVTFMFASGETETHRVEFSGPVGVSTMMLDAAPVLAMADMYNKTSDATTDAYRTLESTGVYDYQYCYFKLDVKQVSEPQFVRVVHNWVAPDGMISNPPGLTLSSSHFWTVEGVFEEDFRATGQFSFNKNILDGDIVVSQYDSLVILYRQGAGHEWQPVAFTKTIPWQLGIVYVDNLRPGEYTLAVWDEEYVGRWEQKPYDKYLKIYPNPGKGHFAIDTFLDGPGKLEVYTAEGRLSIQTSVTKGEKLIYQGSAGVYFIHLKQNGKLVGVSKGVIY